MLPKFCYHKAKTIDEALRLLSEYGRNAKVLAGGTDLLIALEEGTVSATHIVDVKGIPELRRIEVSRSGALTIGACVTVNEMFEADNLPAGMDALTEAASVLATYQVRNRATVGGNLCNASPACDLGPPLLVLGARLRAVSPSGARTIPLSEFFSGVKLTCCRPEELITEIHMPAPNGTVSAFLKRQRIGGHDLALVNAAAAFSSEDGLRIALGAVASTPVLIDRLAGLGLDDRDLAAKKMIEAISPIDDVRSSRLYRERMAGFLIRELLRVLDEKQAGG